MMQSFFLSPNKVLPIKASESLKQKVWDGICSYDATGITTTPKPPCGIIWIDAFIYAREIKAEFIWESVFLFSNQCGVMLITSKGDWIHFYGYDDKGIHEVIKKHGRFYRCKLVLGEGLIIQWEPLKDFKLVTD